MKNNLPLILLFVTFFILGTQRADAQAPTASLSKQDAERIAKVKKDIAKIGVDKEVTVSRIDNRDFFGRVQKIGVDDFEIVETDSKIVQIFKYVDIKNVRSGDGRVSALTGKRSNSRFRRIRLIIAAGVLVTAVIVVVKGVTDPRF